MSTTEAKLGCVCGFQCENAKALLEHRKVRHEEDAGRAWLYVGDAIGTQRKLQRQGAGVEAGVDQEVQARLKAVGKVKAKRAA